MATLNTYLKQVQRITREAKQDLLNPQDLVDYINEARREVAARAQCIRVLTPISGQVISASVVNAGSGYTNPVLVISSPDFPSGKAPTPNGAQALGTVTANAGTISAVNITYGGDGYFAPLASITDPTGTGASVTLQLSPINKLNPGQEQYPFSSIDVTMFPGVGSVYMIKSVSVIYANYRYSLPMYDFSTYQARIRQYPFQYQYVPTMASQYGQGASGSFFAYPLPSQLYQWEFDCFCLPQDLTTNLSVEALPDPWTDAVQFYAAHKAYMELQNLNAARYYLELFDNMTLRKSNYARPGRVVNPYGRY